jgi:cytidylate kinase
MNVSISGLTAAGKTTHAQILAGELGYRYVSGLGTLARVLDIEVDQDPPSWVAIEDLVAARRSDGTDEEVERELDRLARSNDSIVFDVWALPWTSSAAMHRLWLESSPQSRAWKAFVSQGEDQRRDVAGCETFIDGKDAADHARFLRTFGIDLLEQRSVFDATLDNSAYIAEPTALASQAGIEAFTPVVAMTVAYLGGEGTRTSVQDALAVAPFPGSVTFR